MSAMSAQCGSASTCVVQRTDAHVSAKARSFATMRPNSQHCVEHNSTFVGLEAQANKLAHGLAHEMVHEFAMVGEDHALNALHADATYKSAGDAGASDVDHEDGHRNFSERVRMACRDVSNLQIEPQAGAGSIILALPPFVECASNAPFPAAWAGGRSDEPHRSVSRWPL